jgi:NHLM bacteriocin system ABC transporter ATP-binding protein
MSLKMTSEQIDSLWKKIRGFGEEIRCPANQPIYLSNPDVAFLLVQGEADLFSVQRNEEKTTGPRSHLIHLGPGSLLFGRSTDFKEGGATQLLVGQGGTLALRIPVEALDRAFRIQGLRQPLVDAVEQVVSALSETMVDCVPPRRQHTVTQAGVQQVPGAKAICSKSGMLWLDSGLSELRFGDRMISVENGLLAPIPLTPNNWAILREDKSVTLLSTEEVLANGFKDNLAMAFFLETLASVLAERLRRQRLLGADQLSQSIEADKMRVSQALRKMISIHSAGHSDGNAGRAERDEPPLLRAVRSVSEQIGVELPQLSWREVLSKGQDPLDALLATGRIRKRKVILKGEWWNKDMGPLLAFRKYGTELEPAALIPRRKGGYTLEEPSAGDVTRVTKNVALTLEPLAFQLYRPFPIKGLDARGLLEFATHGLKRDFALVLGLGMLGGFLALITPLATGLVFDSVIPGAERGMLFQLVLAMLAIAFGQAMFSLTRNFALLRTETRMSAGMQAAIWDRLISLPAPFFRKFTSGDLARRAQGIDGIRRALAGAVLGSVLAAIFSVWNIALLFFYDAYLAMAAVALVGVAVLVSVLASRAQIVHQRAILEIDGQLTGLLYQLLVGISKLRVAGTENRAFSVWANGFAKKREHEYKAGLVENRIQVFSSIFHVCCSIVFFWIVGHQEEAMPIGMFLGFFAAFGAFQGAAMSLANAAMVGVQVVPLWERAQPILETAPEVSEGGVSPGDLSGRIELNHLSFRYAEDGPLVLDDVNLEIKPGEFVAIVGPSGSGKSTVLRLLLGFEKPISGGVFYDAQPLSHLDLRQVRNQFGVVLQNSRVMGGDIFSNIVGSTLLTLDDAWKAAEMAALDTDIKEMPMGMHTVTSEGGGTLSGGQRQRLMIARALANSPRILFFDEATSALDNRTQAIVSESLEQLRTTRIVIAHRLSTIRNADKIIVMKRGRVVEQGRYAELMALDGTFAALAKRQIA